MKQMLDDGLKNNRSHKYQIPMTEPVDFSEKEFQVNPYEFGFNILADSEKTKTIGIYKLGSIVQRKQLLSGILDANGIVGSQNSTISYKTNSLSLADDVCEVVCSLGGIASVQNDSEETYIVRIKTPLTLLKKVASLTNISQVCAKDISKALSLAIMKTQNAYTLTVKTILT